MFIKHTTTDTAGKQTHFMSVFTESNMAFLFIFLLVWNNNLHV